MDKSFIEKTVEINATPANVWRVFTDPLITRQMGGEYVTDWKVGSSFSWKALDGYIYSDGTILELEPEKLLKHNLFNLEDKKVLSVITYRFDDNNGTVTLHAREDLAIDMAGDEYEGAVQGWDFALKLVKEKAENLQQQL